MKCVKVFRISFNHFFKKILIESNYCIFAQIICCHLRKNRLYCYCTLMFMKRIFKFFRSLFQKNNLIYDELRWRVDQFEKKLFKTTMYDEEMDRLIANISMERRLDFEFEWSGWLMIDYYPDNPEPDDIIQVEVRKMEGKKQTIPYIKGFKTQLIRTDGYFYTFIVMQDTPKQKTQQIKESEKE